MLHLHLCHVCEANQTNESTSHTAALRGTSKLLYSMFGFSWKLLNRCRNKERSSASAIKERERRGAALFALHYEVKWLWRTTPPACLCAAPLTWWGHAVLRKQKSLLYRHKSPTSTQHLILKKNTAIKTQMELKNQTERGHDRFI